MYSKISGRLEPKKTAVYYRYTQVFRFLIKHMFTVNQGCGSGSGLDPDSMTLWIRIRNPDPGARK
jgi:hypothetical protein